MQKLFVFMIDALCASDIEQMKELNYFNEVISKGSYVASLEPVYPALTYCCHTSILTGKYIDGHGIINNEDQKRGCKQSKVWFGLKKDVKAPTLLDLAREHGLTTASICWPVSAGADYTYNWPMIVPYGYHGYDPLQYLDKGNATQNLLDKYYWKYGRFQKGNDCSLDLLTMAISPDLIRDFGQPDVMLVKMCDLDTMRHTYGVYSEEAKEQLRKHNEEFGVLLESIKRYGDYDNTNFVIMGDHGQTDIECVLNINTLLEKAGFIRKNDKGEIVDLDCFGHSTCLTCNIELKNPEDKEMEKKVRDYLESLKDDPDIQLDYVYDKKEMEEIYHAEGPYDFIIESKRDISFSDDTNCPDIFSYKIPGSHKCGAATHGSSPSRKETTLFIASGPSVKQGVVLPVRSMVDEATTMARMIGFEMNDTDGKVMEEILK
ncbi:MAG: ectonucleotide pyrophosphatase/phosphodiesterase [Erysipelotrichaceae bacterium]|nr:ectonucleotide pyrophosphatase/phosphodiesterase [Erysipelotrichaceae bacterium]